MMLEWRQFSWWLWCASAVLLTGGLFYTSQAFLFLIGLSAFQILLFLFLEKKLQAFPVQVRAAYFAIVLAAYPEPVRWIYWIPFVGTWGVVISGYCPLARLMSLLPWNRREEWSAALVKRTLFSRPVRGSILQGLPPGKNAGSSCDC